MNNVKEWGKNQSIWEILPCDHNALARPVMERNLNKVLPVGDPPFCSVVPKGKAEDGKTKSRLGVLGTQSKQGKKGAGQEILPFKTIHYTAD